MNALAELALTIVLSDTNLYQCDVTVHIRWSYALLCYSGINFLILSLSLASHVSTHLLMSAHLYYHHHSHHPSLLHSFTPGSKLTFSTNPSHLRLLLSTGLPS